MNKLSIGPRYYQFDHSHEPRLRLAPGETVEVEIDDAFSGQIRTAADRRDKHAMPYSNPLTGPISVAGAEPGDSLSVRILSIEPLNGQCATRTAEPHQLCEWLGTDCPHGTRICPIEDGQIHWSDTLAIPYAPMLGTVGTAPACGAPTTGPAGPHGGNLDIIEVCPGNSLHLPVFVPGGHLYLGDAHAAMGHGELSATGLEMAARATLLIDLAKKTIPGPRIESPDEIMAVATGCPMERASAQAFAWLILWMEEEFGWNRWHAYDILTHVARVSMGYYGIGTVAVKISRKYVSAGS
jgi:amidase